MQINTFYSYLLLLELYRKYINSPIVYSTNTGYNLIILQSLCSRIKDKSTLYHFYLNKYTQIQDKHLVELL